ncbi:MAG: DUF2244 domain-containing protein [Gammaproteobacteria bacterium]|nr:DUF2244 domain-containing protein [Gammaproteobacteria bacterium]
MIDQFHSVANNADGFIVMPNRAMSWRMLVTLYLIIALTTLTIGLVFYLHGFTLILPFSGIEVVLLGAALYITAWRGGLQEVILFTGDDIVIERGHHAPEETYRFQRAWAKIVLERSWNSWYPSRLLLRSHGKQIEIGEFLNEQERQGLAKLLCSATSMENKNPGGQPI